MTPIYKAHYHPVDEKFPILIEGPTDWNKMSRDEAIELVGELLDAVNKLDEEKARAA